MHKISALPTEQVQTYRMGAPDGYGNPPERAISDGGGNPCRHCLKYIPAGKEMLVLAHRPFPETQPYAETGPIFLCAEPCARYEDKDGVPETLTDSANYLIKGYGSDNRIVYGTGIIAPQAQLTEAVANIFIRPNVAYIHIRSALNNCYHSRIDRA
ncbi:Protein of unknown function [Ruegeria halocynthiae]|uniref:DUF1203 domain-containing protein n=1 Tax=Ruegeria halocynthiae TaxID=985054 RepID=A0A1H3ACV5_9RHOB|nr:DUF1203 domain-containing protein [Ruegeria halocynthiae]SDX27542.1 Protein of unknown function [Ruegeria halocynthiae]